MRGTKDDTGFRGDACEREWILGPFLDGELPQGEQLGVEEHLEGCATCRTMVEQFRNLDELARNQSAPPRVTAEEWGAVWASIRARSASAPARPSHGLRDWALPLLAAAALILLGVWIGLAFLGDSRPGVGEGPEFTQTAPGDQNGGVSDGTRPQIWTDEDGNVYIRHQLEGEDGEDI